MKIARMNLSIFFKGVDEFPPARERIDASPEVKIATENGVRETWLGESRRDEPVAFLDKQERSAMEASCGDCRAKRTHSLCCAWRFFQLL